MDVGSVSIFNWLRSARQQILYREKSKELFVEISSGNLKNQTKLLWGKS
ncbi:MAG: hypothetical protein ABW049_11185 [Spongiibacteraceae bacterium]